MLIIWKVAVFVFVYSLAGLGGLAATEPVLDISEIFAFFRPWQMKFCLTVK